MIQQIETDTSTYTGAKMEKWDYPLSHAEYLMIVYMNLFFRAHSDPKKSKKDLIPLPFDNRQKEVHKGIVVYDRKEAERLYKYKKKES